MTPDVQKIHHHSLRSSVEGLFFEWIYGDGWRLVEIFLGGQTVLRGLSILFLGGMAAEYYATFPYRDQWVGWGIAATLIGAGRMAGTVINGKWRRSPRLRLGAGACSFSYQGMHTFFFWEIGLSLIAVGFLFWTVLEGMGVVRSMIDIRRRRTRTEQCPTG